MKRGTFDIGIDLGTTSAKMACCRSGSLEIIPNREGANQTPCAVWLNPHGQFVIGQNAKEALSTDPDNVQVNFIRDLGSDVEYTFPRSSRRMKPEELAAELLKSLRIEAEQFAGREIRSAVITTQPNASVAVCAAIKRAASVAGFEHCLLLQDAMAAALAAGATSEVTDSVLIYDFGGNQFNASILQVREGMIQVTTHAGDSFIGGVNLDRSLVETVFIPALKEAHPELNLAANNPKTRAFFAKLQAEGEAVKLRFGHANETSVFIPNLGDDNNGQPLDFHCELTRAHLEMLAAPLVERSISICKEVLADAHVTASGISNVIPVGGMVAMPFVRQRLEDLFGHMTIPVSFSVDPTTAVVRGAAMFAETQSLPDKSLAIQTQNEFEIELDYQPITPDSEPLIKGVVHPHDAKDIDFSGFAIEFSKVEPQEWRSRKVGLSKDGRFIATLSAEKAQRNTFRIESSDATGVQRSLFPDSITISVAAASIAQVGLTHSIGLALSDNAVLPLFEKGTPLPARRRVSLHTAHSFKRGESGDVLKIPLVEGENQLADRNRVIGFLSVPMQNVARDLPAGTEIEVTIEIDESRQFTVSAYVPVLDQEFEQRISLHVITPTYNELAEQLRLINKRLDLIRNKEKGGETDTVMAITDVGRLMRDAEAILPLAATDSDAARRCASILTAINSSIEETENALEWPSLVEDTQKRLSITRNLLAQRNVSTDNEKTEFTALARLAHQAIERHDAAKLRECSEKLDLCYFGLVQRDPSFWIAFFEQFKSRFKDRQFPAEAEHLIAVGNQAISNNDINALKQIVRSLFGLLNPASASRDRAVGFGSGILSASLPKALESGSESDELNAEQMIQRAVEAFNRGQEMLKQEQSETKKREILAGFETARSELLQASQMGSGRARENLRVADDILDRVRKNFASELNNRAVESANSAGAILSKERNLFTAWQKSSPKTLKAAFELAKQAKRDIDEAARIDPQSEQIQRNLRGLNQLLAQLVNYAGYSGNTGSTEPQSRDEGISWLKRVMQKLRPTHKQSQAPNNNIGTQQAKNEGIKPEKHIETPLEKASAKGHKDLAELLLNTKSKVDAKDRGTPEVPGGRIDDVHFSVTSPRCVLPGCSFMLDVWAHLKRQRQAVIKQAREAIAGGEIVIQSKGPIQVARGTVLSVLLKINGMSVNDPQDTIYWKGEIGNARFPVTVPDDAKEGSRAGLATIYLDGVQIAKIHFSLMVGKEASAENDVPFQVNHHRKAFASYASQDRNDVLTSIQGMQKADPGLDVFYDEANLRSGASWEQELKRVIPESDVFYLFWSASAKASQWVDMEWRWALERRGIEFIDPVPLVSPEEVPPPEELGGKHFKDWVLAYRRRRP